MRVVSGQSAMTTSGTFSLDTINAGMSGVSGSIHFATGTTSDGASGRFITSSGPATQGMGGSVEMFVGVGNSVTAVMSSLLLAKAPLTKLSAVQSAS